MPTPKIATCCYCGTRAALVLRGEGRHELSCSSCGAPLHNLKMLPNSHVGSPGAVRPSPPLKGKSARKKPKKKHRKGFGRRLFEEAWDVLDDILD